MRPRSASACAALILLISSIVSLFTITSLNIRIDSPDNTPIAEMTEVIAHRLHPFSPERPTRQPRQQRTSMRGYSENAQKGLALEKPDDFIPDKKVSDEADDVIRSLESVRLWSNAQGLKLDSNLSYIISQIERYGKQHDPARASEGSRENQTAIGDQIACKGSCAKPSLDKQTSRPKKKKKPKKKKGPTIDLDKPARKLKGPVQCEQCKKTRYETWKYPKTDGTFKILCRFCRQPLLDQKYGKKDLLDRALSGGAYGSNRRKF